MHSLDFLPYETSTILELRGLKDAINGEVISDANVQGSIYDENGKHIITVTMEPLGNGNYRGIIPHNAPLKLFRTYLVVVRAEKDTTKLTLGRYLRVSFLESYPLQ